MNWKQVKDYEGYYVSDMGEVVSDKQFPPRFLKKQKHNNNKGDIRYRVSLSGTKIYLNTLVAEHFIPNPKKYPIADHINRNPFDNRVVNLRWVTRSQNNLNTGVQKNNVLGEQNIQKRKSGRYRYRKIINGKPISETFDTLKEAKKFKEKYERKNINFN